MKACGTGAIEKAGPKSSNMSYRFVETTYSELHPCKQPLDSKWLSKLTGNYLKNRKADTNEQIMYDGAAPLCIRDHYSFQRSNLVEAAINAK
jgi:hypothetical protein